MFLCGQSYFGRCGKKKICPGGRKGDRWIMIAHALLCWQQEDVEDRNMPFLHFLPPISSISSLLSASTCEIRHPSVSVKKQPTLCQSATSCQGSSPADNRHTHWGNQKLSNEKSSAITDNCALYACPTTEHWLQSKCTNGLFINRDH